MAKLKLAVAGIGSACGGCDVAILDINEKILDLAAVADIVFWNVGVDGKFEDIEAMKDGSIDVALYNGLIANEENEHLAHLFREKSKILIAFGSCAVFGGVPGLANVATREEMFRTVFYDTVTTHNPDYITPQTESLTPDGETLTLPEILKTYKALHQVVEVDYYVPGCPPVVDMINAAIEAIATGKLPPKGATIASEKALCDECEREKEDKKVTEIKRVYGTNIDTKKCLLEQGVICMGPATRGGCGTKCINANMPCSGCYGPPPGVVDQGAKMIDALTSMLGSENGDPKDANKLTDQIVDPLGIFYRYTLPVSLISKRVGD